MGQLLGYLPYLLFLACPLMMVACFLGMRGMGHSSDRTADNTGISLRELPPAEQIARLQTQITALRTEQDNISEQIQTLASDVTEPAPSPGDTSVSTSPALARG